MEHTDGPQWSDFLALHGFTPAEQSAATNRSTRFNRLSKRSEETGTFATEDSIGKKGSENNPSIHRPEKD